MLSDESTYHNHASIECENMGGRLAIADNEETYLFLNNLMMGNDFIYWVGARVGMHCICFVAWIECHRIKTYLTIFLSYDFAIPLLKLEH